MKATTETPSANSLSVILSSGREVTLRTMKTMDLIFMEKQSSSNSSRLKTETERTMAMLERLSTDPKITFSEMQELPLPDFRKLTELMGKAGGVEEENEEGSED